MKPFLLLIITLTASMVHAQEDEIYVVTVENLNVRSGPGTNYPVVGRLGKGEEVVVLSDVNSEWYRIDVGLENSYAYAPMLSKDPEWNKMDIVSGQNPKCDNISNTYDSEMDNYLKVNVGSNTDVVIKMMRSGYNSNRNCIRIVYIRSGDSFKIKNIPEGKYYLKIAYGKDWRQKIVAGKCYGKFMRRAIYEKGDKILNFHLEKTSSGYNIPIYELSLDVVETYFENRFNTNNISEEEFNL